MKNIIAVLSLSLLATQAFAAVNEIIICGNSRSYFELGQESMRFDLYGVASRHAEKFNEQSIDADGRETRKYFDVAPSSSANGLDYSFVIEKNRTEIAYEVSDLRSGNTYRGRVTDCRIELAR